MPKQKTQKQPLTIEDFKAKQEREMFLQEMNITYINKLVKI